MNPQLLKDSIISRLEGLADSARRDFAAVYYPSSMEILGCTGPSMKEVLREHISKFKALDPEQQWECAFELIDTDIFEAQQLAFMLIHGSAKAMNSMDAGRFDRLGSRLENWVSVDSFSVWFGGYAWREGVVSDEDVMAWTKSPDFWTRRKALVFTVPLNQRSHGGMGDTPRTLMVCSALINDRHDMVVKAMSWALRELSKRDIAACEGFIRQHRQILAKRIVREVETKLRTGRKNP